MIEVTPTFELRCIVLPELLRQSQREVTGCPDEIFRWNTPIWEAEQRLS